MSLNGPLTLFPLVHFPNLPQPHANSTAYVLIIMCVPCMCDDRAANERPTKRQKLAPKDGTETFPVSDTSQTAAHGK
jgi:hypothetical protein